MATSRSDPRDEEVDPSRIHPTPSRREAAAIAAAMAAHLAREDVEEKEEEPTPNWAGERWRFAGRLEQVYGNRGTVSPGIPTEPWTAADRLTRR